MCVLRVCCPGQIQLPWTISACPLQAEPPMFHHPKSTGLSFFLEILTRQPSGCLSEVSTSPVGHSPAAPVCLSPLLRMVPLEPRFATTFSPHVLCSDFSFCFLGFPELLCLVSFLTRILAELPVYVKAASGQYLPLHSKATLNS